VEVRDGKLIVDGKAITVTNQLDPTTIKWGDSGAEYIVEATGKFLTEEGAAKHFTGGAKKSNHVCSFQGQDSYVRNGSESHELQA
jgi:glyceraldehyde 3-phosphate dehydrogenase